jgi:deoxyribonuclease-4
MLRFGTSGIPLSTPRPGTPHGIHRARELGLDCLEMAWVNGVKMGEEAADRIAAAARETGLELTAHGPYYVNLCGAADVVERSLDRLLHTARLAERCGAKSFCFHAGFYQKLAHAEADRMVREGLTSITNRLRREGVSVDVRPELTGKPSQVGSLDEILGWSESIEGVRPCVDFSHQYARHGGAFNTYREFGEILERIGDRLGRGASTGSTHIAGTSSGPRASAGICAARVEHSATASCWGAQTAGSPGGWWREPGDGGRRAGPSAVLPEVAMRGLSSEERR